MELRCTMKCPISSIDETHFPVCTAAKFKYTDGNDMMISKSEISLCLCVYTVTYMRVNYCFLKLTDIKIS